MKGLACLEKNPETQMRLLPSGVTHVIHQSHIESLDGQFIRYSQSFVKMPLYPKCQLTLWLID